MIALIVALARLEHLKSLTMLAGKQNGSKITAAIGTSLRRLEELMLGRTFNTIADSSSVTDEMVEGICQLSNLTKLSLSNNLMSWRGIASISSNLRQLMTLNIGIIKGY